MPTISLAYLTTVPLPPPEAIRLAAELGYDAVGLRSLPAAPGGDASPLIEDASLRAETRRAIASGVPVFDMEIVRLGADFTVERFRPFLDLCGELGVRAILTAGDDPDESRLIASYAAFCDAAAAYGLTADLEFMPWTRVPDARAALRIVEAAGQPNGRVLVDALHAGRSRTTLADLAAIPAGRLSYAQICDAPGEIPATDEGLIHTARQARLLPGEGGIDLVGIFSQLPAELPISVEVPHLERTARLGVREWARQALDTARATLDARDEAVAGGASLRRKETTR
ncbi:sugar phosphate isomerase/epimerase [Bosea sp. (in: a-proteobacteria)]|uniref:sugar phosphate isomerase/epimerase family protein n=1 Tax=Bosea sp. (in: a-proteobacteria) TaxID=1871050 RepID=UPI001ACB688A|nr:sugar phosphate isomerase/epimerase [Bosea sp. (in: a-proteobacteria)]MBN9444367.1 sugar phosphate isomerase/epimerase [Bosea sp. (in: a-proteobacteria)]